MRTKHKAYEPKDYYVKYLALNPSTLTNHLQVIGPLKTQRRAEIEVTLAMHRLNTVPGSVELREEPRPCNAP